MTSIIQCPKCSTRLKIAADSGGSQYRCPTCSTMLRVGGKPQIHTTAAPPAQEQGPSPQPPPSVLPVAAPLSASNILPPASPGRGFDAVPSSLGGRGREAASAPKAGSGVGASDLQPFLRKWMIAMSIVAGLVVLLTLAGFVSDLAGLFAAILSMLMAVGCIFGGRFWIAIMLGRRNMLEGVLAVFIPLVGLVMALQRKGELLKGAVLYATALVFCLLGLATVALFKPSDRSARKQSGRAAELEAKAFQRLRLRETELPKSKEVRLETYRLIARPADVNNFVAGADSTLRQFKYYEPGSFTFDSANRTVMFKHTGNEEIAFLLKMYLCNHYTIILSVPLDHVSRRGQVASLGVYRIAVTRFSGARVNAR